MCIQYHISELYLAYDIVRIFTRCCSAASNDSGPPPKASTVGMSLSYSVRFCFGLATNVSGWERQSFFFLVFTNAEKIATITC